MIQHSVKFIYWREVRNYFNTPIGYVFLIACLFFNYLFFFLGIGPVVPSFWETRVASIESYMDLLPITFILLVPAVSMRIWAEERKSGTIELLSTLPLTALDLVLGKFLAAWTFVGSAVIASLPLAITISWIGDLDWGTTLAMYIGALLMAGAYVSMGMVISALTREQIVAFILIFFVSLAMFISNYWIVSQHLRPEIARVVGFFSHSYHNQSFGRGLIDSGDVLYYLSFMALMVAVNVWLLRRER